MSYQHQNTTTKRRRTQHTHGQVGKGLQRIKTLFLLQLGMQGAAVDAQRTQQTVQAPRGLDAVHKHQGASRELKGGEKEQ